MAIGAYEELTAAVGAWSFDRSDLPAADLVTLGEARLNRDLRLRVMEAEAPVAFVAGARTAALPAGYLAPVALWLDGPEGRARLRRVAGPLGDGATAGAPACWAVEGETLALERPCAAATSGVLRFLRRLALSEAEPTNWLLSNHPDAYLAAALVEAALWAADEAQAMRWQDRYQAAVDAINNREARSREAPLRTDVPGPGGGADDFDITKG
ncbi:MAG: hypothetical protein K1X35_09960 [Caulobacteraceae bacterium]|nr:hypothetical protein [Caulobacteraceae bacterium]